METVSKNSSGTYFILKEEKKYLGLATGFTGEILKTTGKSNLLTDEGLIFKDGKLSNWPLEGIINFDNEIIPFGPFFKGKTLADMDINLKTLLDLSLFFSHLQDINKLPDKISATGIYFTDEDSIILFPDNLLNLVYSHQEESYNLDYTEIYNHPEFTGEKAVCFTLGVLAYKMAAGMLPFKGNSITETRELMRRSRPVPPRYIKPGTRKDFSDIIVKSLFPDTKSNITLSDWLSILKKLSVSGLREELSDKEAAELKERGMHLLKSRRKNFKRSEFFLNNWKKMVLSAVVIIFISVFISTPLTKALKGPVTKGLPASEVVSLYYESINNLDSETLDDCVTGKAGKIDSREVTGLFVISKVRQGYEGTSGLINAPEWIKNGKPPLKEGENLYGLSNIKIKPLTIDTFEVSYDRWTTEFPVDAKDTGKIGLPVKTPTVDNIHLVKKKDTWFIDSIERTVKRN